MTTAVDACSRPTFTKFTLHTSSSVPYPHMENLTQVSRDCDFYNEVNHELCILYTFFLFAAKINTQIIAVSQPAIVIFRTMDGKDKKDKKKKGLF